MKSEDSTCMDKMARSGIIGDLRTDNPQTARKFEQIWYGLQRGIGGELGLLTWRGRSVEGMCRKNTKDELEK